jgi:hypothetical protein
VHVLMQPHIIQCPVRRLIDLQRICTSQIDEKALTRHDRNILGSINELDPMMHPRMRYLLRQRFALRRDTGVEVQMPSSPTQPLPTAPSLEPPTLQQ